MKNIFLFDMDGTLTEPREKIQKAVIDSLISIHNSGHIIGIISGSDFNSIKHQCLDLLDSYNINESIYVYACAGTKKYIYNKQKWCLESSVNLQSVMGRDFYSLVIAANKALSEALLKLYNLNIPFTGSFIDYRGSMINLNLIGRDFNQEGRRLFIEDPNSYNLRLETKAAIEKYYYETKPVTPIHITLGGQVSLDITALGLGKEFVLEELESEFKCWFVGDKCEPNGNDYNIYIKLSKYNRAKSTSGPSETVKIIDNFLKTLKVE